MGWYFCHKTRAALLAELREVAPGCRLLDTFEGERGAFWRLIECGPAQIARGLPAVLIACDLVESGGGDGHPWGYKPMDESMGPYYYDAPLRWLDRAPVLNADWRASVVAWHDREASKALARCMRFDPAECGGAFDGVTVTSDADSGL